MTRRLLSTVALATILLPAALTAQRKLTVERFDATIEVEKSGWIDVREEIQVRFEGAWNGIFRTIPVEYRTPQGFSYKLRLEDVTVTGPGGEPYEFWSSRERHYRKLKIRVPGADDATRSVFIHYRVPNGLKFWDDYDELYWNVTGDEWEMPILSATAMVILPDGVESVRTGSWTGGYGSTESAASVEETDAGLFFETRAPLNYREGLTIAVAWNPGVVERPGTLDLVAAFLRANWLLLLPLLSLGVMWHLWSTRGRDPTRRAIAPQYEPPEGLTPGEVGTLIDNRPDMRDITAGLVDLAVRGYLRIEEIEPSGIFSKWIGKTDYALVPLKPRESWLELREHEQEILRGVFGSVSIEGMAPAVKMSDLENEFYRHLSDIRDSLYDSLLRHRIYTRRPDKTVVTYVAMGVVVLAATLGLGLAMASRLGTSELTAIVAAIGSALPVFAFGVVMPARTVEGTRALEHALGFEEFLDRVESDRYRRMITSPEMFERFLPYAMAFGVEKKWAAAFADIYRDPPSWYVGTWDGGFRTTHLVHSMGRMSSAAATTLASSPRSSGGSGFSGGGGGGGFSGGGFGGGGGGGW